MESSKKQLCVTVDSFVADHLRGVAATTGHKISVLVNQILSRHIMSAQKSKTI